MSAISKIEHAYNSFNKKQKMIADFILQQPQDVIEMSVHELAQMTHTAPSTIIRFAQRLGYQGYPNLKIELAIDLNTEQDDLFEDHPSLTGTFNEFLIQEQKAYINTVNKTFKLINNHNLMNVIELVKNARRIYLIGIGASSNVCEDLEIKLSRIDYPVQFYKDVHVQLANSIHLTKEDVLIAVSYRGNTNEVNTIVQQASKRGIPTIAITQNNGSPLAHWADIVLPVPSEENEFRLGAITSRNATLIMTDIIYLGIIKTQIDKSRKDLIDSRKIIYKLRKV